MSRIETFGDAKLYLGDCKEILPTLGKLDAIITDPPYGQGYIHSGGGRGVSNNKTVKPSRRHSTAVIGDDSQFNPKHVIGAADQVILWGAHKFHERLPRGTWLVWDKVPTGKKRDQGDGEAAWKNDDPPRAMRICRHLWDGVCVKDRDDLFEGRVHPMQKPVGVMAWCVAMTTGTVCDPYMGSGATGLACLRARRPFIGIEIAETYFDIACRRIEEESRQGRMI